jgi:hypothetical protein
VSKATPKKTKASTSVKPGEELAVVDKTPKAIVKTTIDKLLLADEGAGSENIGAKDLAIPRISILQSLSPQATKGDPQQIKGAEAGDFYDNVANVVAFKGEGGFLFIPVAYRRANLEWIPRKQGGGLVADHGADDAIIQKCTKNDKNQMMLANGHEIVTTAEYYIIVLDSKGKNPRQAVISLAKTQLKKARKLNTMLRELLVDRPGGGGKFNPAIFYSVFAVNSIPESNDQGSWMGWNISRQGDTLALEDGSDLYLQARQFREAVTAGSVKVAAPSDLGSNAADSGAPEDGATL